MQYKLLSGTHRANGERYSAGDMIDASTPLDVLFPGKFKLIGEQKPQLRQEQVPKPRRTRKSRGRRQPSPRPAKRGQPRRYLESVLVDGAWKGKRCFIIGGGPSLNKVNFSRLKGELVIGVNRAFEKIDPCINHTIDSRFLAWLSSGKLGKSMKDRWAQLEAVKTFCDSTGKQGFKEGTLLVRSNSNAQNFPSIKNGLLFCGNSGVSAVQLAACLGASPIYLLGFDCNGDEKGNQNWWHGDYPTVNTKEAYVDYAIPMFEKYSKVFLEMGVQVVNLNCGSAITSFDFGSFKNLKLKCERPLVVGFYTDDDLYRNAAAKMKVSVHRFGLEYDLECIPTTNWMEATNYKSKYLLKMCKKFPNRPMLYVDVDAEMKRYPLLLDNYDVDLSVPYICWGDYGKKRFGRELLSGAIYFRSTEAVVTLFQRWRALVEEKPAIWEQKHLQKVVGPIPADSSIVLVDGVRVRRLPDRYCQIFDLMKDCDSPVIQQNQASRAKKRGIPYHGD